MTHNIMRAGRTVVSSNRGVLNYSEPIPMILDFGTGFDSDVYVTVDNTNWLVGGGFNNYKDSPKPKITLLDVYGNVVPSFNAGTGFDNPITNIDVYGGKYMCSGYFTTYNGTSSAFIARINSDGTYDGTFNVGTGFNDGFFGGVEKIVHQSNGKYVVIGDFTSYNGTTISYIIGLNDDGTINSGFNVGTGLDSRGFALTVTNSDKIYAAGLFTSYNGNTSNGVVRINADGSYDNTFDASSGFNGDFLHDIKEQSDGKIIVVGTCTSYAGNSVGKIVRINSGGTYYSTFNNGGVGFDDTPYKIKIQTDGKILIGGSFESYNGITKKRMIRLNSNGSIDNRFDTGNIFADNGVQSINILSNGNILVGGSFTNKRIALLDPDGNLIA